MKIFDFSWSKYFMIFHDISLWFPLGSRPDICGSLRPQPNKASFAAASPGHEAHEAPRPGTRWTAEKKTVAFVDPDGKIGRRLLALIHRFKILEIPHVSYLMKSLFWIFWLNQVESSQIPLLSYKFYNFYICLYIYIYIYSMKSPCLMAARLPCETRSLRFGSGPLFVASAVAPFGASWSPHPGPNQTWGDHET